MATLQMFEPQPASDWCFAVLQAEAPGVDAALDQIEAADARLVCHMTWEGEGGSRAYLLMSQGPIDGPALLQRLRMFRLPVDRFQLHAVPADDARWQHIGDDLSMLGALMNGDTEARQVSATRKAARRAA